MNSLPAQAQQDRRAVGPVHDAGYVFAVIADCRMVKTRHLEASHLIAAGHHSSRATRLTSATVVSPVSHLARPSAIIVVIPPCLAAAAIALELTPGRISFWVSSSTARSSNIAARP